MSKDKKSLGTLILALLLFLAVAAGSWFYFSQKAEQNPEDATLAKMIDAESDKAEAGDDHDHHDHSESSSDGETVGTVGKIYKKAVDPVLGERGLGDPNAPVTVREFFSLTCNHCAAFHSSTYQTLKEKYIDTGKIYFIYEEFPLNGPALYGSMIARCMPEERYAGFIDLLLTKQDEWAFSGDFKAALKQNAALAGMGDEEFETCFSSKEMQEAIGVNIKVASEQWEIRSTPSFVFNDGEKILSGGAPIEKFDVVIAELTDNKSASVE